MRLALPWAALGLLVVYRRTWGAKTAVEVDALRRRLVTAQRETREWQREARYWRAQTEAA